MYAKSVIPQADHVLEHVTAEKCHAFTVTPTVTVI